MGNTQQEEKVPLNIDQILFQPTWKMFLYDEIYLLLKNFKEFVKKYLSIYYRLNQDIQKS